MLKCVFEALWAAPLRSSVLRGSETLPVKREQETRLSLTNRLSKRNDVADLTSVIKIRLKKLIPRIRPFKVEPTRIDPPSVISY